jgi:hypothetical protein
MDVEGSGRDITEGLSWNVHGGTDGNDQETVRIADDTAEIRNKYPRNVSNSKSETV